MLVSGTHFFPDADPYFLGHKTLAVNLSDLAAMGATPRWATLALSLPAADEAWLERFSAGFFELAQRYGVDLVGGDTTRGPLNLCVTIFGEVSPQQALRRSGAQVGDDIWVSGMLGDAALALAHLQGRIALSGDDFAACAMRLHQPQPRIELGLALRGIANSAIDVSDGLLADLGHILECSNVGAEIRFDSIPAGLSFPRTRESISKKPLDSRVRGNDGNEASLLQRCVLSGGDDYELCFTVPASRGDEVRAIAARLCLPLTRIGKIVAGSSCIVQDAAGNPLNIETEGYDHFR
jgi:thiamine-monophosphate kinase